MRTDVIINRCHEKPVRIFHDGRKQDHKAQFYGFSHIENMSNDEP